MGRASVYGGAGLLGAALCNRLFLTPWDGSLALTQSRSDILCVIAGATLVLYGVGRAEIGGRAQTVSLDGVDVRQGFSSSTDGDDNNYNNAEASREAFHAATAVLAAVPNARSFAVVEREGRRGVYFAGLFREQRVELQVPPGGVVDNVMSSGKRAYLADMKVVPVKEVEFGFLPEKCQVRREKANPSTNPTPTLRNDVSSDALRSPKCALCR